MMYAAAMKGVSPQRTFSIRFEISPYQLKQLRQLGSSYWPSEYPVRDELCRRLLLAQVPEAEGGPLPKNESRS